MNPSTPENILNGSGADDAAELPPLVAWIRRWLPDAAVWPPQRGGPGRDPSDARKDYVQGVLVQGVLLRKGRERFGEPAAGVRAAIEAISDIERLVVLIHRVSDVRSWDELLEE